jgi:hypothetical protein
MNKPRVVQFITPCTAAYPKVHKFGVWKEGAFANGSGGVARQSDGLLFTKHVMEKESTKLSWRMEEDKEKPVKDQRLAEQRLREWIALKDRASYATYSPYALANYMSSTKSLSCRCRPMDMPKENETSQPSFSFDNVPPVSFQSSSLPQSTGQRYFLDAVNRSGTSGHGAFFTLTNHSQREVTIHALHLACSAGAAGTPQRIRVYAKAGAAAGFECAGGAWATCLDADGVVLPVAAYPTPHDADHAMQVQPKSAAPTGHPDGSPILHYCILQT